MMEKARILIVEDEWVTAEDIRQTVEGMGYEVVAAVASGEQAIEKVQKEGADLVLMDIILQGDMDGIAAGSRIYSEMGIPVVYLTAHADEATLQRAKSTGPFGYILKPFNERDLRAGIEIALEKSRSERSLAHINSVLRAIRQVNRLVREEKDADVLIHKACDALVGARRYCSARVIMVDKAGNYKRSVESGPERGILPKIEMLQYQSLSRIEKKALNRQGVFSVSMEDLFSAYDLQLEGNHKRSVLFARLEHGGRIFGLLSAAIASSLATVKEELELFGELAAEIAFGLHDIATEEKGKKTEVALIASEERYHRMINNSADGMLIIDEKGMVLFANPAAEEILGRKQGRLVGQSFGFPMAASETTELDVVCGEGRVIVAEMRVSETEYEGQTVSLAALRDITQHKQTQATLEQTLDKLSRAMTATVGVVAMTVEARDPYTAGHQRRVAELARVIAREMGNSEEFIDGIYMAGLIHDIGKIAVPAEILSKPTKLLNIEFELIKNHSQAGYDILKDVEFPWPIAQIVLQHHERMDGGGYPHGLKGEEILLEARIIAVADVVEAMAMHRPYRAALGIDVALKEIADHSGVRYDSQVADACLKVFRENKFQFNSA